MRVREWRPLAAVVAVGRVTVGTGGGSGIAPEEEEEGGEKDISNRKRTMENRACNTHFARVRFQLMPRGETEWDGLRGPV